MENRQLARKRVLFSFQYALDDVTTGSAQLREAKAVDLSDRGIRFETGEKLHIGTRLKLVFEKLSPFKKEVHMNDEGIVVWSIQPSPDEALYRIGLKYV